MNDTEFMQIAIEESKKGDCVTEQILGAICERFGRAIMVALDLIVFLPAPI